MIEQFLKYLSYKFASVCIVLLAMSARIIQLLIFSGLSDDRASQIQAAHNLLIGKGVSIYEVWANDLSAAHFTPLIKWPPGYSVLLAPFLASAHDSFLWGTVLLDIVSAIAFIWVSRKLIMQFDVPVYIANLYTLVIGFFSYDFCLGNSSDLIALVIYQIAILLTLQLLNRGKTNSGNSLVIACVLFCCCLMRYMFIPIVFIIPAYIIFTGTIRKEKDLIRQGIFVLGALTILLTLFLAFNKTYGGSATYLYATEKGFYPHNVSEMMAFSFSSFGDIGFFAITIRRLFGISYSSLNIFVRSLHMVVLLIMIIAAVRWVITKKGGAARPLDHLFYLTLFSSLAVVGLLSYLSLTNHELSLANNTWTYVLESRYYAVPVFFLQLWFILYVFKNSMFFNSIVKKLILGVLIGLISITVIHNVFFLTKKLLVNKNSFFENRETAEISTYRKFFHQFIIDHPDKNIICCSNNPTFNNFAALWENVPSLYIVENNTNTILQTKKEVLIFVAVKKGFSAMPSALMNNVSKEHIGQFNDYEFYSISVKPNTP